MSTRSAREIMRDEMVMRSRIIPLLATDPLTVPALAERLGEPSSEVMVWLMGMRRYGLVEEDGKADRDGFYSYTLTEKAREGAT